MSSYSLINKLSSALAAEPPLYTRSSSYPSVTIKVAAGMEQLARDVFRADVTFERCGYPHGKEHPAYSCLFSAENMDTYSGVHGDGVYIDMLNILRRLKPRAIEQAVGALLLSSEHGSELSWISGRVEIDMAVNQIAREEYFRKIKREGQTYDGIFHTSAKIPDRLTKGKIVGNSFSEVMNEGASWIVRYNPSNGAFDQTEGPETPEPDDEENGKIEDAKPAGTEDDVFSEANNLDLPDSDDEEAADTELEIARECESGPQLDAPMMIPRQILTSGKCVSMLPSPPAPQLEAPIEEFCDVAPLVPARIKTTVMKKPKSHPLEGIIPERCGEVGANTGFIDPEDYDEEAPYRPLKEQTKGHGSIKCGNNLLFLCINYSFSECYVLGAAEGHGLEPVVALFPHVKFIFVDQRDATFTHPSITFYRAKVYTKGKRYRFKVDGVEHVVPVEAGVYCDMSLVNRKRAEDPTEQDDEILRELALNSYGLNIYPAIIAKARLPFKKRYNLNGKFLLTPFSGPSSTEGVLINGTRTRTDVRGRIHFINQNKRGLHGCDGCSRTNGLISVMQWTWKCCDIFDHRCRTCHCAETPINFMGLRLHHVPFNGSFSWHVQSYGGNYMGGSVSSTVVAGEGAAQAVTITGMFGMSYDVHFIPSFVALRFRGIGRPTIIAPGEAYSNKLKKIWYRWNVINPTTAVTSATLAPVVNASLSLIELLGTPIRLLADRVGLKGGALSHQELDMYAPCIAARKLMTLDAATVMDSSGNIIPACGRPDLKYHLCFVTMFACGFSEGEVVPGMVRCGCSLLYPTKGLRTLCTIAVHAKSDFTGTPYLPHPVVPDKSINTMDYDNPDGRRSAASNSSTTSSRRSGRPGLPCTGAHRY